MAKVSQLDEHGAATRRIGIDVQRWEQWVRAGLRGGNRALERWGGADSVSYRCQNLVAVHDTCTGDRDNNKVAYSVFHYLNRHCLYSKP